VTNWRIISTRVEVVLRESRPSSPFKTTTVADLPVARTTMGEAGEHPDYQLGISNPRPDLLFGGGGA
jgi:hypothetical protein